MKFSLVNGVRREAEKGMSGICVGCDQPTIPKCGPVKVKHWAHKSKCECDHWWENETEWHRAWKNNFPAECQEFRQKADDGEWHIADVKTKQGQILEFQHSFLGPEERMSRNAFYGINLIWVVNGLRKRRDLTQFKTLLGKSKLIIQNFQLARLHPNLEDCAILKEWSECNGPVFFDFGPEFPLWCLFPKSLNGGHYIGPLARKTFIDLQNGLSTKSGQSFSELMKTLIELITAHENPQQPIASPTPKGGLVRRPLTPGLTGMQTLWSQVLRQSHYSSRRPRRRFRF